MNKYEKACEIVHDIYVEMYKQAEPPADFDKLIEDEETDFFQNHILSEDKQMEIIDNICGKIKYKQLIINTVMLGASPKFN